jgi:hypothetical protein
MWKLTLAYANHIELHLGTPNFKSLKLEPNLILKLQLKVFFYIIYL